MEHYIDFWRDVYPRFFLPEGYDLVENEEHKRQRIQRELQEKKRSLSYLEKRQSELAAEIEEEEKELLALNSPKESG